MPQNNRLTSHARQPATTSQFESELDPPVPPHLTFGFKMKLRNRGLLAATWFVLSTAYLVVAVYSISRYGICGNPTPTCMVSHIFEYFVIPGACIFASLFFYKDHLWSRIVLGAAAVGAAILVLMMLSSTIHNKPYFLMLMIFGGCVWTLMTVTSRAEKTEQSGAAQPATALQSNPTDELTPNPESKPRPQ